MGVVKGMGVKYGMVVGSSGVHDRRRHDVVVRYTDAHKKYDQVREGKDGSNSGATC